MEAQQRLVQLALDDPGALAHLPAWQLAQVLHMAADERARLEEEEASVREARRLADEERQQDLASEREV